MKARRSKITAEENFFIVGTAAGRHCVVNVPPGKVIALPRQLRGLVLHFFPAAKVPAKKFEKQLLSVIRQKKPIKDFNFKFELTSGDERILLLNSQPFFQSSDATPLILVSVEDITNVRKAEAARESELRKLDQLTHDLEDRVDARTDELQEANRKLHELSVRMLEAQEMERRHLARELHDEIGQQITCLQILTGNQLLLAPPLLQRSLKETRRATSELLQTVRQLSADLRPQLLDDFGLIPALEWHFARFQKRTGIEIELLHSFYKDELLNSFLRNVLFRVAQEALTNVARHASANRVIVDVSTRKGLCRMVVRDEGKGFDMREALKKGSFGLSGMQERVFLAGGKFQLDSSPGKGTTVALELPLISVHTNALDSEPPRTVLTNSVIFESSVTRRYLRSKAPGIS